MTVVQTPAGWIVTHSATSKTVLAGPFATMAEGWRWIDRRTGEPISKREDRSQWFFDNQMGGGR
jgi:hypothetical protein